MRDRILTSRAKILRRDLTAPERTLWHRLRARRTGAKFRRQHAIGPYIADFACRAPMLIVEVDGETHAGRENHDAKRTRYLEQLGYRVLRFTNEEVTHNLDGDLQAIEHALASPLSPSGERLGEGES